MLATYLASSGFEPTTTEWDSLTVFDNGRLKGSFVLGQARKLLERDVGEALRLQKVLDNLVASEGYLDEDAVRLLEDEILQSR